MTRSMRLGAAKRLPVMRISKVFTSASNAAMMLANPATSTAFRYAKLPLRALAPTSQKMRPQKKGVKKPANTGAVNAVILVPTPPHFSPACRACSACSLGRWAVSICFSMAFWLCLASLVLDRRFREEEPRPGPTGSDEYPDRSEPVRHGGRREPDLVENVAGDGEDVQIGRASCRE